MNSLVIWARLGIVSAAEPAYSPTRVLSDEAEARTNIFQMEKEMEKEMDKASPKTVREPSEKLQLRYC